MKSLLDNVDLTDDALINNYLRKKLNFILTE